MPDTQLSKQCVNGANLHACLTTGIAQGCRSDMVVAIGLKQRESSKPFDDLISGPGTREALQQFLENQACRDDDL